MYHYALTGSNGVMVADSYESARTCQKYIRASRIKKYKTFEDAETAVLEHLMDILPYEGELPTSLPLNRVVTVKQCIQKEEEDD